MCSVDWDKMTLRAPIADGCPMSLNSLNPSRASCVAPAKRPVARASVAPAFNGPLGQALGRTSGQLTGPERIDQHGRIG